MIRRTLMIEGHRGYMSKAYENSLKGFQLAFDEGLAGIETDLWLTKDRVVVIAHGFSVRGMEDMWDPIKKQFICVNIVQENFSDIKHFKHSDKETELLTLEELFKNLGYQQKMYLNIEFKDTNPDVVEESIKLIKKMEVTASIRFTSFHHQFKALSEKSCDHFELTQYPFVKLIRHWDLFYNDDHLNSMLEPNAIVCINILLLIKGGERIKKFIKDLKAIGGSLNVYNITDLGDYESDELYQSLVDNGVDTFCCNHPDKLLAFNARNKE